MITARLLFAGLLLAVPAMVYGYSRTHKSGLPLPGPRKQDPNEREKMLDSALEDSMIASDPPSIVQPDVKL